MSVECGSCRVQLIISGDPAHGWAGAWSALRAWTFDLQDQVWLCHQCAPPQRSERSTPTTLRFTDAHGGPTARPLARGGRSDTSGEQTNLSGEERLSEQMHAHGGSLENAYRLACAAYELLKQADAYTVRRADATFVDEWRSAAAQRMQQAQAYWLEHTQQRAYGVSDAAPDGQTDESPPCTSPGAAQSTVESSESLMARLTASERERALLQIKLDASQVYAERAAENLDRACAAERQAVANRQLAVQAYETAQQLALMVEPARWRSAEMSMQITRLLASVERVRDALDAAGGAVPAHGV